MERLPSTTKVEGKNYCFIHFSIFLGSLHNFFTFICEQRDRSFAEDPPHIVYKIASELYDVDCLIEISAKIIWDFIIKNMDWTIYHDKDFMRIFFNPKISLRLSFTNGQQLINQIRPKYLLINCQELI